MEKVRLGRTNLVVTRLGWGGIPIQRVSESESVPVIQAVINMGVNLLDTARAYTDSEHKIGLALKGVDKPVIISSKSQKRNVAIYEDIHESLRQLQVKKIHIYHLHNLQAGADYETVMSPGGAYEGLLRARDEGLIDHIGITSHSLGMLERAIEDGRFDVIMACYSFLEPAAADKVFPLAKAKDIGILAMKPLSGGVIDRAGPALRYVLSTEGIVPIPGSETIELANENWKIFMERQGPSNQDSAWIESMRTEYDRQFCRRCDYCQPCNEKINIQFMLGVKSIFKRLGSRVDEVEWMREMIKKARNCTECGDCASRCPYQLPIPELLKERLAWYDSLKNQ